MMSCRQRLAAVLLALLLAPATARAAVTAEDAYIEGYAAAILEREFQLKIPSLRVERGVISLSASELGDADRDRVIAALSRIRGAQRVEILAPGAAPPVAVPAAPPPAPPAPTPPPRVLKDLSVGFLPGGTLFYPLVADPRWPHFSAAYHYYINDDQLEHVGAVSFGETFTLYRDRLGSGWWEVGVQAGVFAVFDLAAESADLVNADYFVGIPLAYRYRDFSAMFRLFHQSSHLGDEFLLRTQQERINLSYEAVDLKLSYELGEMFRFYGGGGVLFHREPSELDPWSIQYGAEFRGPHLRDGVLRPIAAVDLQHREENNWSTDFSLRAGVQVDGVLVTRSFQLLLEYFRGRSPHGQFYKNKIDYIGLGAHFHF